MDQLDAKHLRVLYYQYKDTAVFSFAISALILLINFMIFSLVVKPQYILWQDNNQKLAEVKKKIDILEQNNRVLSSLDPASLSSDLQVALAGLPKEQDYLGIMSAVASASTISGIILDDYGFNLGKIVSDKPDTVPVVVTVGVTGNADTVHKFIQEIHQKVPVANVTAIDGSSDTSTIKITFYSKSLAKIALTEDKITIPLTAPTASEKELLQKLAGWQQTLLPADDFSLTGSASADISPF